MERTTILVRRESGDCVVAGEDTGEVVGRRRVPVVVGTAVSTGVAVGTTLNVLTPTKPFVSLNDTS